MDGHRFDEVATNHKRRRPEWSQQNDDETKEDAVVEHACLQAPHTLRLLKLIEEGTLSHARMAASHLASLSASPIVLWDLLGRLQTYLRSPEWSTRVHASLAMQGVAQHIPPTDQCDFLEATFSGELWLTIDDVAQGLETVLTEGRVLLAACETDDSFETQEARLKRLDESQEELQQDFVEERVRLQREILAQRLGLGGVVRAVGGTVLGDVITKDDLLMNDDASARQTQNKERIKRQRHYNNEESCSIRALLVLEMQQQQEQTGTRGATSHKSPQTLLATELIYRMFDPSWHVRHGALLGILSLLRAWKGLAGQESFGMWPHDILARCICVLSLDRFGDYAGTSIGQEGDGGDGVVAPVREIAAQVLSVLWMMAPHSIQDECLGVLVRMSSPDEWEIRHGALLALKYIIVMLLTNTLDRMERSSVDTIFQAVTRVAQASLSDKMSDVQSVAAQILMNILKHTGEREPQRVGLIQTSCQSLWDELGRVQSVSSCAVDFVSLFSALICADCSLVCQSLGSRADQGPTTFGAIVEKLLEFINFDSSKVKLEALKAIAGIVGPYATMITESDRQNNTVVLVYSGLVERIFGSFIAGAQTFAILEDDEESRSRDESLYRVQDVAWAKLVGSAGPVLQSFPSHRNNLLVRLLLSFVKIQHSGIGQGMSGLSTRAAGALARLLVELDVTYDRSTRAGRKSFFETMFALLLYSPWTKHVESACILYQAMYSHFHPNQRICCDVLHQFLVKTPPCLTMGCLYSDLSKPAVIESCERAIGIALLGCTLEKHDECEVEQVWNQAFQTLGLAFPGPAKESTPAPVNITSMRVHSLIAGAVVSGGKTHLPFKLTALVRALMTSLKSERAPERLTITSESLALLLKTLSDGDNESHARVKTKIMENICVMLASESLSSRFRADGSIPAGVTQVLTLFVSQLPPNETLESVAPIWNRLQILVDSDTSALDYESTAESLSLLAVICKTLRRGTVIARHLIENLTPPLVQILCTSSSSSTRTVAIESAVSLCKTDPELALDTSLPFILKLLADNDSDPRRLGALRLLRSIVEEIGIEICPFVRCLLPITMTLMTDSLEDCAKQAAQSFACLVRVSPLVRQTVRRHWETTSTDDLSGRVIDHLIHGEPLPPCVLPPPIVKELTTAGVSLRGYQIEGITWLRFLQQVKLNGALCDDMGLGKTLQALVAVALSHYHAICADASAKPVSLVICPSTLVGHWLAEIHKFFPLQDVLRGVSFEGSPKQKFGLEMGEEYSIVVTSYSVLRREVKILSQRQWHQCILDEGHLMKNPKTVTAKSARRIRAHHKLILTGTPVQNRVHELWAAFDFLMPNFLGSQSWFSKNFARPIGNGQLPGASAESISSGMEKLKLLHQQVLPFILRREKEQVLRELPPKCITDIPCTLSSEQRDLYEMFCRRAEVRSVLSALNKSTAVPGNGNNVEDDKGAASSSLGDNALRSLLYLRLLCTHPSLVQANRRSRSGSDDSYARLDTSGKLMVLNELLRSAHICGDELAAADNDASVLYCDFDEKQGGDEVSSVLCSCDDTSIGGDAIATTGQLATSKGTKCLIFAQFTQSLDVVEQVLFQPHMPSLRYLRLDGTIPIERRGHIVETFNRDDSIKVMLLTTRVGGLGLNLTGASTVIFLEHDYNPHADLQAMDRVHRIGQTKAVNVYRLITQNTIEEKIMKLQETKMAMSKAIVNSENSTMYSMGTDRLLDIFTFRSDDSDKRSSGELTSNLGALDETYSADDYASLSVQEFIRGFHSVSES